MSTDTLTTAGLVLAAIYGGLWFAAPYWRAWRQARRLRRQRAKYPWVDVRRPSRKWTLYCSSPEAAWQLLDRQGVAALERGERLLQEGR